MQGKVNAAETPHGPHWEKLLQEAKDDPQLAKQLEAMERVMEQYRDTLHRLAQS